MSGAEGKGKAGGRPERGRQDSDSKDRAGLEEESGPGPEKRRFRT